MNPIKPEESNGNLVLVFNKSSRNVFIAKLLLMFGLSSLLSYAMIQQSAMEQKKGQNLIKEEYIQDFETYRADLLSRKNLASSPVLTTLVSLIFVSFLFGAYELVAIFLGLLIGKFYNKR